MQIHILNEQEKLAIDRLRREYEAELLTVQVMPIAHFYDHYAENRDNDAIRAILSSSKPLCEYKLGDFTDYLFLDYDDITEQRNPRAFDSDLADEIRDYLVDLGESAQLPIELSVCCDYGESRSAAIAAAITRLLASEERYDIDFYWMNVQYHPNPLVYRFTCAALGIDVSEEEAEELVQLNREQFHAKMGEGRRG